MNQHERIVSEIHRILDHLGEAVSISPASVALSLQSTFGGDVAIEPGIAYASLEHFKQMARGVLSGRFDPVRQAEEAAEQELFSTHLQPRYPLPRKAGDEPLYKLRSELTGPERAWNVQRMRRTSTALQMHADALEAEGLTAEGKAA